jgi:hypothetical protein
MFYTHVTVLRKSVIFIPEVAVPPKFCAHSLFACVCEILPRGDDSTWTKRMQKIDCTLFGLMRNFVIRAVQPSLFYHMMSGTCNTREGDVKDNFMFYAKFVRSS